MSTAKRKRAGTEPSKSDGPAVAKPKTLVKPKEETVPMDTSPVDDYAQVRMFNTLWWPGIIFMCLFVHRILLVHVSLSASSSPTDMFFLLLLNNFAMSFHQVEADWRLWVCWWVSQKDGGHTGPDKSFLSASDFSFGFNHRSSISETFVSETRAADEPTFRAMTQ